MHRPRLSVVRLALVLTGMGALEAVALAQAERAAPPPAPPEGRYVRVTDENDGQRVRLEAVIRTFTPADGPGPTVSLVGAVHIADKSFYQKLQTFLDAQDVVLFEGVKPPGAGKIEQSVNGAAATDAERVKATKRRIRFLATFIEQAKREHGSYPATLQELATGADKRVTDLIAGSLDDAWGHAFVYTVRAPEPAAGAPAAGDPASPAHKPAAKATFDVVSLGADGAPGGEGAAADLAYSAQPRVKAQEMGKGGGIQQQFAGALGLTFQLDEMDHNKRNWRNSDLSVDQVQDRLEQGGGESDQMFTLLDGSSLTARLAGLVLRMLGSSPMFSTMGKVLMVEMLGRADELLTALPGDMGALMDVIIKDRNTVVVEDLAKIIKEEPGVRTIGIIYGAGHMPDLERRLTEDLRYRESGAAWNIAIDVDLSTLGSSAAEAKQIRQMIRQVIDQQLKMMKPGGTAK